MTDSGSDMRSQRVPIYDETCGWNGNSNGKRKCSNCSKRGHVSDKCWEREENAARRPSWWYPQSKNEQGRSAHDGNVCEFMLCAMTVPMTTNMLNNPNIWIGDTGTTQHITAHTKGMTNLRMDSMDTTVQMGNGNVETTTMIGDIPSIICDKLGNEKAKMIL